MASPGVIVPVIDLTVTLPTTRSDGSVLAASDIESVCIMRNSIDWKTLPGPFTGPIHASDSSATTGEDTYTFYVTDTAGVRSEVSAAVSVTVSAEPPKAPPSVGTLTAVVHGAKEPKAVVEPTSWSNTGQFQNSSGAPTPNWTAPTSVK